jgi:hypothetical protein
MQAVSEFNPYRFGLVGASDGHNSITSAEENNYSGKMFTVDGTPELRLNGGSGIARHNWMLSASGLAGVWASENTREGVFDALARKEAFATSGPRIKVRLFAGWDLPQDMMALGDWVDIGYARGVPMGQDLPPKAKGDMAPVFAVWAAKDAAGTWLQRLQIVKGWVDDGGQTHEKVVDVGCSDGIRPASGTDRCADNNAQVDLTTCKYSDDKGDAVLKGMWRDSDFNAKQPAFYYVRAIENPSCRWSTFQAIAQGQPLVKGAAPTIQERAWSSPVWYTPK